MDIELLKKYKRVLDKGIGTKEEGEEIRQVVQQLLQ